MNFPDYKQVAACRKHAQSLCHSLRKFGQDVESFSANELRWQDLCAVEKEAKHLAKSLTDRITDEMPDERASEIEAAYDLLIEIASECATDKDARTARNDRSPWAGVDLSKRPTFEARTANASDLEHDATDQRDWCLEPQQRMRTFAQARGSDDLRGMTAGQFLRATVIGAQNEVERRALAEGTDSAGGYTVPEILSSELIDALRAESVVVQAGARTVPLTSNKMSIAKLASDPVPAWRVENAAVNESDPTFTQVVFEPKSLAVMTKVSFELMDDSLNIATELPRILSTALAQEMDRVCLFGSGTAPEPEGIANMSGISTAAHDAALANYQPLISGRTSLLTANVGEPTAVIMHPRDEGTLAGLVDSTGQPLVAPSAVAGVRMLTTTKIPVDGGTGSNESTIFMGNFRRLMIGMRQGIRVEVLKERYADTLQYALVAHMRMDLQAEHEAAFHTITGVQG